MADEKVAVGLGKVAGEPEKGAVGLKKYGLGFVLKNSKK